MTGVSLRLDTEDMAQLYESASENQYQAGLTLFHELKIAPGERVLDVGSGTGRLTAEAAKLAGPDGTAIGIDPLSARIEIASQKAQPNLSFRVADVQDLSQFASCTFDVVYLNAVFHWLPDQPRALQEIARVLKPAGRLGITTASGDHPYPHERIKARVMAREPYRQYPDTGKGVANSVTRSRLEWLLREAGFRATSVIVAPHVTATKDAQEMVNFVEASSFGNFLGHLPDKLQEVARQEIEKEYEEFQTEDGIRAEAKRLVVVAIKA